MFNVQVLCCLYYSFLLSFFFFFQAEDGIRDLPLASAQCAEVLRIPTKKAPERAVCSLDEDEVTAILTEPDRSKREGQRDHVLCSVLYNTGARVQEALNLTPCDLHLETPFHVRLFGKERKERISPLWPETVDLLKALLKRQP